MVEREEPDYEEGRRPMQQHEESGSLQVRMYSQLEYRELVQELLQDASLNP